LHPLGCGPNEKNLPPFRNKIHRLIQVATPDGECSSVEDLSVKIDLPGKAAKAVAVRFDFVTVQYAVHDGEIDAYLPTAKPQLFKDHRTGFSKVSGVEMLTQSRPNLGVAEGRAGFLHGVPRRASLTIPRTRSASE